jgi:hypothetical protein
MKTQTQVKNAPVEDETDVPIVAPIDPVKKGDTPMKTRSTRIIIGVYVALVLLGVGTGYLLSRATRTGATGIVNTAKVSGSTDTATFKDSAIGVIQKGGTDGEGTHSLIRDGGPSQTVTLMSSVVDLDQYVGKKVKVFGQTLAAQKAAWLMDVGRVELQ